MHTELAPAQAKGAVEALGEPRVVTPAAVAALSSACSRADQLGAHRGGIRRALRRATVHPAIAAADPRSG
jgi:hypothetical protein